MKSVFLALMIVVLPLALPAKKRQQIAGDSLFNFVFVSDSHYGLNRASFRDSVQVPSTIVNRAMIAAINQLPVTSFPDDGGVRSGRTVDHIEFVVNGGDISNRMQRGIQTAEQSWQQFIADYNQISTHASSGLKSKLYLLAGNHDVSNAIGHYKKMSPERDATVMAELYNRMVWPRKSVVAAYNYAAGKVHYSFGLGGIHFQFVNIWPDSSERRWMTKDLRGIRRGTPVIVFSHDQPDVEAAHFSNPFPPYDINEKDRFENLIIQKYQGDRASGNTIAAQRAFAGFIRSHTGIKAYFHGNANWNEFYEYSGPDTNIHLPVFRVDSPMKGKLSESDESLLSFLVVSINKIKRTMTVRECFYNRKAADGSYRVQFGATKTITI